MKLEAEDIERRLEYLDRIHEVFAEYSQLVRTEEIQKYVLAKGREQMSASYIGNLHNELKVCRQDLEKSMLAIRIGEENVAKMTNEIDVLNRELSKSDAVELKKKYQRDIDQLSKKIDENQQNEKENLRETESACRKMGSYW